MNDADREAYWRTNLRLMAVLLAIWAFVSLGLSVIFVEQLNNVSFLNMPFGFWMGQQGSIITFVALIGVYVWRMGKLDDSYGMTEENEMAANAGNQAEAH
jgi:putative solute:sodium symporter small subunit